jgi:hypothetical protein
MDIVLQSQERYNRLAILHWPSLSITYIEKEAAQGAKPIGGHYSGTGGQFTAFFRYEGDLFVLQERLYRITEGMYSTIEVADDQSRLQLLEGDTVVAVVHAYNEPTIVPLTTDPTPFVEEEHYNFLLFVHNILNSPARRKRIYQRSKG